MIFAPFLVWGMLFAGTTSANLLCYDSDTMKGDERPLTEQTCTVNSVCEYKESVQIDGYVQNCANPSFCTSDQADSVLWKNVICCTTDFCNVASGQPPVTNSTTPPSSASSYSKNLLFLGGLISMLFAL
jgi:hypothetical protein